MIEGLAKVAEVSVKESVLGELKKAPSFFDDMPESKDCDTPVAQETGDKAYIITRNESLEGDVHPITGVPFEQREIELPTGEVIEGVFPEFDAVFDAQIPEDLYEESDYKQFKECNKQLDEAIEGNDELKAKFTGEQLDQIKDGISDGAAPDGYVWHHDAECGKIQLVDFETHANTGHTGGRTVWGGGNESR